MEIYTAALAMFDAEAAWEADCDKWDALMPGWDVDEARANGEILSERDFPIGEADDSEDWEAMFEMMWCDPAERALD